jgi:hypothetical protein
MNEQTKDFIRWVSELENEGLVKNREEIIGKLKWSKSYMSQVMNGHKPVPPTIYKKFKEVYNPREIEEGEKFTLQRLIRLEAMSQVILGALAEILANQNGQPVTTVSDNLLSTVNSQVKQMLQKLQ